MQISSAWPSPVPVPPQIEALAQTRQLVFLIELFAHLVERTAPPAGYGFSLAETWAFTRYFGAVARRPDLCLSHGWRDLDTHQKTILSDDWGVAAASLLATTAYQPVVIANTSEWLRRNPGVATPMRSAKKRGPAKSPDFTFEDASGRIHFVEAKGTQGTQTALEEQMAKGREQKYNMRVLDPSRVGTRLVIGTRVPLEPRGRLTVVVDDPPIGDAGSGSVDRARVWLRRVALAGTCRAAGLPSWAAALLSDGGFRGRLADEAAREFALRTRELQSSQVLTGREIDLLLPQQLEGGGREWRVAIGIPSDFLRALLDAPDLDSALLTQMAARPPRWPVVPPPGPESLADQHERAMDGRLDSELPPARPAPPGPAVAPKSLPEEQDSTLGYPTLIVEEGKAFTARTPNMLHMRLQEL